MKKHLIIDSRPFGLFSIFLHTIDCIKWAEDNNYIPHVRWGTGREDTNRYRKGALEANKFNRPELIGDKNNFVSEESLLYNSRPCLYLNKVEDNPWEYYFHPLNDLKISEIKENHKISDIFMCGELDFNLENKFLIKNLHSYDSLKLWSILNSDELLKHRKEVNQIILKYVKIKEEILNKVELFYNKKFINSDEYIGVHVRGTDKKTEYPFKQLTFKHYIDKINDIVSKNPDKSYKIYVASDNNESIIKMADYYGKKNIICHPSIRVSSHSSKIPIHLKNDIDKRKHGEETLIEMLLLSKCNHIIGTDSNFTAVASYYNTEANLIYLNRIYGE